MGAVNQSGPPPKLVELLGKSNLTIAKEIAARLPMNRFSNIDVQDIDRVFHEGGTLEKAKVIQLSVLHFNWRVDCFNAFLGGLGIDSHYYQPEIQQGAVKNKLKETFIGLEYNLDDSELIHLVYKKCTEIFMYISLDGKKVNIELTNAGPVIGFYKFSKYSVTGVQLALSVLQAVVMVRTFAPPPQNGGE